MISVFQAFASVPSSHQESITWNCEIKEINFLLYHFIFMEMKLRHLAWYSFWEDGLLRFRDQGLAAGNFIVSDSKICKLMLSMVWCKGEKWVCPDLLEMISGRNGCFKMPLLILILE